MTCTCPAEREPDRWQIFRTTIASTLKEVAATPWALDVARNGGAEHAMRAALLHPAVQSGTNSIGFTEVKRLRRGGGERRVDLEFHCRDCGGVWTRFELKHNFAKQRKSISNEIKKVTKDLLNVEPPNAVRSLALHQITTLQYAPDASPLSSFHNSRTHTGYKRFLPETICEQDLKAVQMIMDGRPAFFQATTDSWAPHEKGFARFTYWLTEVVVPSGELRAVTLEH